MKILPSEMVAALNSEATTFCHCVKIIKNDGIKMGFTDHDEAITFDNTTYLPDDGVELTEQELSQGLNVDTCDARGVLTSDRLNEDELATGNFDGATVEIYWVDWQNLETRILLRVGNIGEIRRADNVFEAEVRGLTHKLNETKGRIYQHTCDAVLGDARCKVNLNSSLYKVGGTVQSILDGYRIIVNGLASFEEGYFNKGILEVTSGVNAGKKYEIRSHTKANTEAILLLWQPTITPLSIGDTINVTAGCDKQFSTCKNKFDNTLNFRGFPHIPGTDFILSYPSEGEGGR